MKLIIILCMIIIFYIIFTDKFLYYIPGILLLSIIVILYNSNIKCGGSVCNNVSKCEKGLNCIFDNIKNNMTESWKSLVKRCKNSNFIDDIKLIEKNNTLYGDFKEEDIYGEF